jgi:predicted MFS family arabinose efflux permease
MLLLFGWRQVFYFLVIPGLVLAGIVALLMKDAPGQQAADRSKRPSTDWLNVLRSPALLMTATSLFFVNLGSWGLMNWIPSYLLEARGVSILKMGILAALPFVSGTAGYFVGGYVGDKYFADRRHLPIAISLIVSAGFIVLVTMSSTAEGATVMLMCAMFAMCIGLSGIFTLPMVISDVRVAGSALGMVNTAGQIAGFLSPLIIGTTLELSGRNYDIVLAGIATTFCLGSVAVCAVPVAIRRIDRRKAPILPVP